jgi:apolipoprotein N-acyltransferase
MPLRSAHPWGREYAETFRRLLDESKIPFLIGALDFAYPKPGEREFGSTNSALYFTPDGRLTYKYDKIHRVPYGEYIPFRKYLPAFLIDMVDMGRDLTPGINRTPLELPDGLKVSTAVCYEGVFGYLTRDFARRGAKVLLVISNDAWYPRSSEPEQHLANAVMRAVETGLPMVRCGNNGGSGLVRPDGSLTGFLDVPGEPGRVEIKRGRAFGIVETKYCSTPQLTFYVRYGEWLIGVLLIIFVILAAMAANNFYTYRKKLPQSIH